MGTEGNTANLIWRDQIVVNLLHVPLFHFCEMDISKKLGKVTKKTVHSERRGLNEVQFQVKVQVKANAKFD